MATMFSLNSIESSMLAGLNDHIKKALTKRFEEVADKVVREAVEQACKTFEVSLKQYKDMYNMKDVIEVILKENS